MSQQQPQNQRAIMPRWDVPDVDTWQGLKIVAEDLFSSGLLPPHVKSPQAALLIIQKGRELGLPPTYALCNLYVLNGRVGAPAEVMLALIYRDHGDNALIVEHTDARRCVIRYKRRGWHDYKTYEYTIEDAKVAGLLQREPWQRHPAAMLRARAISAVARFVFPDSIAGMYTPDELDEAEEVSALSDASSAGLGGHVSAEYRVVRESSAPSQSEQPRLTAEVIAAAETQQQRPEKSAGARAQQLMNEEYYAEDDEPEPEAEAEPILEPRAPAPEPGTEAAVLARLEKRAKAVQGAMERLHKQTGVSIEWMMRWLKERYNISHLGEVTNEILLELRKEAEEAKMYSGILRQ